MAFGKLGFGIMAFGILDSSGKCPFRDNVIREMIFGKSYVREIGIREIVRHWKKSCCDRRRNIRYNIKCAQRATCIIVCKDSDY